jgi:glycerate kinase
VETATASGLNLVPASRRDAEAASTAGTGELIAAAVRHGANRILLGVGGSATTDGGVGAVAAIEAAGGLRGTRLTVLCDVQTSFEDAATVYGPQKGADAAAVERLIARLNRIAGGLPRDPRGLPGTGAAGGLAGGLWAHYAAELVPGIDTVMDLVGFDALLGRADAVITGEGRLDDQTAEGKAVSGVVRRSRVARVPVWAVVGQSSIREDQLAAFGLAGVIEAGTPSALRAAGRRITAESPAATGFRRTDGGRASPSR